ncbi:S1C family serine protease [Gordonia phthalatica]|uniref:Peptidase S1 n=1 Tax=Gordonia phthalatica TaxID=1136941 RepID=A0A0N7FUB3_9ACTN|nr:trypsin-like peptidase domain-containing protein [Gordonia phthalatica]ALG83879.1 peptidase S1 [Gordonia phthalatica]
MTNGEYPGNDDWRQVPQSPNQPPTGGFPAYGQPGDGPAGGERYPGPTPTGQFPAAPQPTGQFQAAPNPTGQFPTASTPGAQQPPWGPPPGATGPGPVQQPGSGKSGVGKKAVVGLAAVALLAGGIGGGVGAWAVNGSQDNTSQSTTLASGPTMTEQPEAAPGSVQETAAKVLPSVVSITVAVGRQVGSGSGIILSGDGVILTNNHVISAGGGRPADEIMVSFNDGSRAPAKVLGADPTSDIAVIKVDKTGLQPITIGKSDNLKVGQNVIAVGSPLGLDGTVTTGIISSLNRPVSTTGSDGEESVMDAIQTDAAINPGNSGGALVNSAGALIGVNSAIATVSGGSGQAGSIGLGFAIPVDQAMRIADQIRSGGTAKQATLGVNVRPSSDVNRPGAMVVGVTDGGAAKAAGIPAGAVITQVNDRRIASSEALVASIRSHAPGDTVKITYYVGNDNKTVQVTLGSS